MTNISNMSNNSNFSNMTNMSNMTNGSNMTNISNMTNASRGKNMSNSTKGWGKTNATQGRNDTDGDDKDGRRNRTDADDNDNRKDDNDRRGKNDSDSNVISASFNIEGNNVSTTQIENKNLSRVNGQGSGDNWNATINYRRDKNTDAEHLEHRIKFDKYFSYGMDMTGLKIGSKTKQCKNTKDCGGGYKKMCCVNAVMTDPKNGLQDVMYRCMNYKIASANFEFTMNDMSVAMKCVGDDGKKTKSGASYLSSAILVSMISLMAMAFN